MTETAPSTRQIEMIFPDQANHYGTLFAGHALNLLSRAAYVCASRHARQSVVMAACSEVQFFCPVKVGAALALSAQVVRTGRSSMTVEVSGDMQNLATGQSQAALSGRFEMVAVDGQGRPVAIHPEFLTEIA